MGERILVTGMTAEHVRVLTLDRPESLNALGGELTDQLVDALEAADADAQVRAVVLTGSERAFCAGADITELHAISVEDTLAPDGFGQRLFNVLSGYRKPLIAAVQGLALGAGCEIALCCDIVVAGKSAKFGVPEVTLGVIPGGGGTQRLIHALGNAKAMRLLLTGEPITADEACTAGLASDVVPDVDCLATATRIAHQIAGNPPFAVQLAKDAARTAHDTTLSQGLAHERRNFFLTLGTEDMRQAVQAFLDKRRSDSPAAEEQHQ